MTKRKSPVLIEEKESAHSINLYISGETIPVPVGKGTVYIRQPSYLERDQADLIENIFSRHIEVDNEEIGILTESPAPKNEIERLKKAIEFREELFRKEKDETRKRILNERVNFIYEIIENRNAAEQILENFSSRAKLRWLSNALVVDKEGSPLDYNQMHPAVQDIIMEAVSAMVEDIDALPLGLA